MHLDMREELKQGKARLVIIIFCKVKYTFLNKTQIAVRLLTDVINTHSR